MENAYLRLEKCVKSTLKSELESKKITREEYAEILASSINTMLSLAVEEPLNALRQENIKLKNEEIKKDIKLKADRFALEKELAKADKDLQNKKFELEKKIANSNEKLNLANEKLSLANEKLVNAKVEAIKKEAGLIEAKKANLAAENENLRAGVTLNLARAKEIEGLYPAKRDMLYNEQRIKGLEASIKQNQLNLEKQMAPYRVKLLEMQADKTKHESQLVSQQQSAITEELRISKYRAALENLSRTYGDLGTNGLIVNSDMWSVYFGFVSMLGGYNPNNFTLTQKSKK